MNSVLQFQKDKAPISVLTCYDYTSAKIIEETGIDAVLVGDSVSMVMHGFESTIHATVDMMCMHVSAVRRGTNKFIIADLPFLAHRKGNAYLMESIDRLMKCGANSIKIEGADDNLNAIKFVLDSGIPVMGHLGLTPQSIHQLGGYKVQGKDEMKANDLVDDALSLQEAGCFAIVLELVPAKLAKQITEKLNIPTIGIGAGKYTSGQVLVLHDMLGMNRDFNPKFLKKYMDGYSLIKDALQSYNNEVKSKKFPSDKESF
jgi:3-methyl-2-oxobutanoate hydroxymethyltransferase